MSQNSAFPTLREVRDAHVRAALVRSGDNVTVAAALLGVDRGTLYRWLRAMGLSFERRIVAAAAE